MTRPKAIKKKRLPKNEFGYIDIDWEQAEYLVSHGANGTQVAATLGVSKDTIYDRCIIDNKMTWRDFMQKARAKGDTILHVAQFKKAVKDRNPAMLIWLGKMRLGQSENPDKSKQEEAAASAISAISALSQALGPDLIEALSRLSPEKQKEILENARRASE